MENDDQKPIRLIARLDIKGRNLIKGVRFEGLRVLGSPNEKARKYYEDGIDELLYIDAVASLYDRNYLAELVTDVVKDVFVPITVGGGIKTVEDVRALLRSGADKVAINTAATKRPQLLSEVAQTFGSQCVVLSIEAKTLGNGRWEVYVEGGRERTGRDVLEWVEEGIALGAGEVLVTSVDRDGTLQGPEIELAKAVSLFASVPVIISGGVSTVDHAVDVIHESQVDAVAVGKAFHTGLCSPIDFRRGLVERETGVRRYVSP